MTLNDVFKRAYKYKGLIIQYNDNKKINNNLIELLRICVKNNIKIKLDERDLVKIIYIYYSINNVFYDSFIEKLIKLSGNIDIKKIYEIL